MEPKLFLWAQGAYNALGIDSGAFWRGATTCKGERSGENWCDAVHPVTFGTQYLKMNSGVVLTIRNLLSAVVKY
jgi:hypothetical protein